MDGHLIQSLLSGAPPERWVGAILCAARLAGVCVTVPVFSSRHVPLRFRLAIVTLLVVCAPAVVPPTEILEPSNPSALSGSGGLGAPVSVEAPSIDLLALAVPIAAELLVGATLGALGLVALAAVRGAASLISDQIGFSLGGVIDPNTSGDERPLGTFHALLAVVIFLSADLHHAWLRAFSQSFAVLPPGGLPNGSAPEVIERLVLQGGFMLFEAAFSMALPVLAAMLIMTILQGVLTRAIPELEFFVFGFPVRAAVGLGVLLVSLPLIAGAQESLFRGALEEGRRMVVALSSGGA
jgi:flagellar biosynthetic protein FliR